MIIDATIIRQQRADRGWTQQQLADACQVSLRTIQRVERNGSLSHDTLQGLCAVFNIETKQLLTSQQGDDKAKIPHLPISVYLLISAILGGAIGAAVTYSLLSLSS